MQSAKARPIPFDLTSRPPFPSPPHSLNGVMRRGSPVGIERALCARLPGGRTRTETGTFLILNPSTQPEGMLGFQIFFIIFAFQHASTKLITKLHPQSCPELWNLRLLQLFRCLFRGGGIGAFAAAFHGIILGSSVPTGLSKRNGAKLRESFCIGCSQPKPATLGWCLAKQSLFCTSL